MTITLERPDARVARTDSHPDLPLADPRGVRRATTPFGTPARAAREEPLPPGVRLVRKRAAAPTSTLGRKLTMLAPVALLAGVSAGAVTLTPHVQGLVDGVRDQFGGSASSAATAHAMSENAAGKHRAATSAASDAGRLTHHHPHQAKHRAPAPTSTAGSPTATDATPLTGTRATTTAGSHRAVSGSGDTPSATTQSGGKHKATSTAPPTDATPPSSSTPPGGQAPPPTNPAPGTPDPVRTLAKDVQKTLDTTVNAILGG